MGGEWKETTVGEFCPFHYGKGLPERKREPGCVPVFGSNGQVGMHSEFLVDSPGIIIGRKGTVGSIHYSSEPFWPIDTTFYIVNDKNRDLRFTYYLLKTLGLDRMNADSAVPGLNRNAAHAKLIKIPPLPEQRAIAHILGTLDDKIELNRRMNETLEAMAQAIFKSWFMDFDPVVVNALKSGNPIPDKFIQRAAHYWENPSALGLPEHILNIFPNRFVDSELGPIPEGWEVKTLGTISLKPQYGFTATAQDNPVGPKFLRIKDINKEKWIKWSEVPYCKVTEKEYLKYALTPGDIVIARIADPGHTALIEEEVEAVFASYLIRFRPKDEILDRYIQYWLRSEKYWNMVSARQSGSTRANLNAKVLSRFPLVVPTYNIAEAFRDVVRSLRTKLISNVHQSEALASLRDALLPKLISGELCVPNTEKLMGSRM